MTLACVCSTLSHDTILIQELLLPATSTNLWPVCIVVSPFTCYKTDPGPTENITVVSKSHLGRHNTMTVDSIQWTVTVA